MAFGPFNYPLLRVRTEYLLETFNDPEKKSEVIPVAKSWLECLVQASDMSSDPVFEYSNAYLNSVREMYESNKTDITHLKDAFQIWINIVYLRLHSCNSTTTDT